MKKLIVSMLVVLSLVFLSIGGIFGCAHAEKAEISWLVGVWMPESLEPLITIFEQQNPDIKVVLEPYPFPELYEAIEVKLGAKESKPDCFFVGIPMAAHYGFHGYTLPLEKYFTDEEMKIFPEVLVDRATFMGHFICPPLNNSSQLLYYNLGLFEEAGLEVPSVKIEDRWTWKQVMEAGTKITRDVNGDGIIDIWGFQFDQVSRAYQLLALPQSLGGPSGVDEKTLEVEGQISNPEWIEAFQFYSDLHNKWKISPKGIDPAGVPPLFATGKLALFVGGLWNIPTFEQARDLRWGVAPHPYFEGGKPFTPTGSWHTAVNSRTRYPDQAAKLTHFMTTSPTAAIHFLESHGHFPSHIAALRHVDTYYTYSKQPLIGYRIASYESLNTAAHRPTVPGILAWKEVLMGAFEDIRNGADVEESLTLAERRADRILAKYQEPWKKMRKEWLEE